MGTRSRIALLIETSTSWGARIVKGIASYRREKDPWFFYIEPRGRYEEAHLPEGWEGEGIIARVTSEALGREIMETGLPAVNVSWYDFPDCPIPRCTVDEKASGALAAQHFLERSFRHFAYCGSLHRPRYRDMVYENFREILEEKGYECNKFAMPPKELGSPLWQDHLKNLSAWLKDLPKPVGILAWSDVRGRQVTEACQYAGIRVPEEVAVMGGEYDELMSATSNPPLTTIDSVGQEVGYQAAHLLSRMIDGEAPPQEPILLEPGGIITRQSTDTLATNDELLADAVSYIRKSAHHGIRVSDILKSVPMSRRALEERFMREFGRSPGAEIRRVRLELAKQLLSDSDDPIPKIAIRSGFNDSETMNRAFKRELGVSPSVYRRNLYQR